MQTRHVTAAVLGAVALAGATACSTPEPALGGTTATVSIDGGDTGGAHPVRCRQSGFTWYIETPEQEGGFTAVVHTGGQVSAQSVQFRDLGGFTGTFWADNVGEAEATGVGGTYTITGTADGNFSDDPSTAVTARFRIAADC